MLTISRLSLLFFIILNLIFSLHGVLHAKPSTKKQLLSLYAEHPITFLSKIPFDKKGKSNVRLCAQCPTQEVPIHWVSIVPLQYYLKDKMCYTQKICLDKYGNRFGGVQCCRQKELLCKAFEQDLHHIVPELPTLKRLLHQYSSTHTTLDNQLQNHELKGAIGRMFLYMNIKYQLSLPALDRMRYEQWHRDSMPTEWERKRNSLIKTIQGDANPYIT